MKNASALPVIRNPHCGLRCRKNTDGRLWSVILKENARQEFEQARHERDPEMVSRMLVVGRDALNQTMEKVGSGVRMC